MAQSTVTLTQHEAPERSSGFWGGYWKSLKPLDVEEPIDVWVHRPLAYVLARALMPTPISPNLVTLISILFGVAGGAALLASFSGHMWVGGLCIFASAIFDCADGQLARMRGTSSAFGRMLDGVADLVVSLAAVGGGIWVIWSKYDDSLVTGALALALCLATAVTGSFHTGMYDHYKNVFLRLTNDRYKEGEDLDTALERFRGRHGRDGLLARMAWYPYLFYVKNQADYVRRFDPLTARFGSLPAHDARTAEVWMRHCRGLMRVWRGWFGFGSLVFGIALFAAVDLLEWYMLARLLLLNGVFYGYLRPRQRKASRAAFEELGLATS